MEAAFVRFLPYNKQLVKLPDQQVIYRPNQQVI